MHVLVINRYFYPDDAPTSVLLSELAFALSRRGIRVTAIASRLRYSGKDPIAVSRETVRGVTIQRVWSSSHSRSSLIGRAIDYASFYLAGAWRLWRFSRGADLIVAKTDPPLLSVMAVVIGRLRGAGTVNWLQDIFPEVAESLHVGGSAGSPALRLLRPLRNWSLRAAKVNVVVGDTMVRHLLLLGIPSARIVMIPNWADGALIRPISPSQNALRKEWRISDKVVVGYAGNLGRAHDVDTIIEAIALINQRAINAAPEDIARKVMFVFIGDGSHHKKLEREISRRNLTNVQVRPYQPRERLAQTLGVPDIHLVSLNPRLEGLIVPSKFYGVAAAGRPTIFIGAANGEIAHVVERAGCGLTVSPGDAHGLVSSILQLAGDPELRTRMGNRARSAFQKLWDKQRAINKWVDLLKTKAGSIGSRLPPKIDDK